MSSQAEKRPKKQKKNTANGNKTNIARVMIDHLEFDRILFIFQHARLWMVLFSCSFSLLNIL